MPTYADESTRQRELATQHHNAAMDAERRARSFEAGDRGEAFVQGMLEELSLEGWKQLHKRRWPGTTRADLDHVLIGPGGVVVLDTKNWSGQLRFSKGRLWRDQADETRAVVGIAAQVNAVAEVLAEVNLAPAAITGALVFVQQALPMISLGRVFAMGVEQVPRWLGALGERFSAEQVEQLAVLLEERLPLALPAQSRVTATLRRRPTSRPLVGQCELFEARSVDLAQLERAAHLGIEQWMSYLHPNQLELVKRRYTGPSRVRGPAGCGKTVVALHRAAFLAGVYEGRGLFTTYVKTLPLVLQSLYGRLSPATAPRFTFKGVHSVAHEIVREAGVHLRVDPRRASQCFDEAWARVGRDQLETAVLGREYWHEEVFSVIKGRGLVDFEQYADLARIGRRTPLNASQRRAAWDLYVGYQRGLEKARIEDFDDLVDRALALAEAGQAEPYRFVFVDETQDLTLQALRLASALVSHEPDGLTLVGDGQQAIYPGGFTLKEAGISVAGRSAVLGVNYRNTQQVLDFARSFVAMDEFDDLEDLAENGVRPVQVLRQGSHVLQVTVPDRTSGDVALLRRLAEDSTFGLLLRDAAVLCHSRYEVTRIRRLIEGKGIACIDLEEYDGTPVEALKVGTAKRAKGLEFARVYLPQAETYLVTAGQAERERVERERRELFVAMTRARDGLWVCRLARST